METIGRYQIKGELGRGGMAVVYRAFDPNIGREVALKLMSREFLAAPEFHSRFTREARAIGTLESSAIVPLYDFGEDKGQPFLVMRLMVGGSLVERLQTKGMSLEEASQLLTRLAEALDEAHAKGIIHRDLKPGNILFDHKGLPYLADFGIVKLLESGSTTSQSAIGTPAYMSPEHFDGKVSALSDIYALGVILFQVLTGELPFRATTPSSWLKSHVLDVPLRLRQVNDTLPLALEIILERALAKKPEQRYQSAGELAQAVNEVAYQSLNQPPTSKPISQPLDNEATLFIKDHQPQPNPRPRLFISYKRNCDPDEQVALQIYEALQSMYDCFIDQKMSIGTTWAERLEVELKQADFFIALLSSQAIHSEMILAEIELAQRLPKEQPGKPLILPVRLAYREPFPYPLNVYLDPLNWAFWRNHEDTPRLIKELQIAINGGDLPVNEKLKAHVIQPKPVTMLEPTSSAQPIHFEKAEGSMDPQSVFYIERPEDAIAMQEIKAPSGVTITIKAPRQMGKSSLLYRVMDSAIKLGKQVAFIDFQLFDQEALNSAELFYQHFCSRLSEELDLDNKVAQYWQDLSGNNARCTRYLKDYLLAELNTPLLLAMDEVDSLFGTDFRNDFFGMLRSWHNNRAHPVRGRDWKRLDLVLVTSTEPSLFIEKRTQSPFNVGEQIQLTDFTPAHVAELNRRHGTPLTPPQTHQLYALLAGHPYLTRRALYLIAEHRLTPAQFFNQATDDHHGPFANHLRYYFFRLHGQTALIQGLQQIIHRQNYSDDYIAYRLWSAGLIRYEGATTLPRCQLYAAYFTEKFKL